MFKIVCNIQSLCLAEGRYFDFMCKGSKISDGLLVGSRKVLDILLSDYGTVKWLILLINFLE